MANWAAIRAEFPALERWTYLNTATYGQMPRRSMEAVARHWERRDELACSDFLDWYSDTERIRASIARLIHASPDDIAFVPNAAAADWGRVGGVSLIHRALLIGAALNQQSREAVNPLQS